MIEVGLVSIGERIAFGPKLTSMRSPHCGSGRRIVNMKVFALVSSALSAERTRLGTEKVFGSELAEVGVIA